MSNSKLEKTQREPLETTLLRHLSELPIEERALLLFNKLENTASELRIRGSSSTSTEAARELANYDAVLVEQAREMIKILRIEVTRLRLGIEHFHYGRLSKSRLTRMTKNWNHEPDPEGEKS